MKTINILFEITVYSGVIFIAITLLKACFKNRMSPFLHYAIWFVLILRLMMPVTIASPVRLFVIPAEPQNQAALGQLQPDAFQPVTVSEISITDAADTQPPAGAAESYVPGETQTSSAAAQIPSILTLPQLITFVWLAGTGVCLSYLAVLYISLRKKIRRNAAQPSKRLIGLFNEVKADMGIKTNIKLVCQYEYGTPSLMFPNIIMMPIDALVAMDDEQVKFALCHELAHFKRGDHIASILLSLLNAVYWFNPFVWAAFSQMRRDVEAACDRKVVKKLDDAGRSRYASLILSLSARPAHRQLVLGMSRWGLRKAAQRRVKCIFMKGESKMSVKLLSALLAVTLIFTCFTTACQPVTEELNGGDPTAVTQGIPKLSDSYKVSEHWSETVENDKVKIIIDADVLVPSVTEYPVVRVEPAAFTQQRVDELVNCFAGNKQLYLPHVFTKTDYQRMIDANRREQEIEGERVNQVLLDSLRRLEKMQTAAPEDSPLINTDTALTYERDYETGKEITAGGKNFLNVIFDNGEGGEASISIENFDRRYADYEIYRIYNNPTKFSYSSGSYDFGLTESMYHYDTVYLGEPEEECGYAGAGELFGKVDITSEYAIAQADIVISCLGIKDMMLVSAEKYVTPDAPEKCGYELKYARESGGMPLCRNGGVSGFSGEKPPEYSPPLVGETLILRVSKDGLDSLKWTGCANVVETVNENVELLPFEDIKQKLKEKIICKKSYLREGQLKDYTVIVTSAELRMGYIGADKPRQAIMVPVWVFSTEEKHTTQGKTVMGNMETYMFSAIDGGAIERRGGASTYLIS